MKAFAFIDASNLFYGGSKSLGWSIDYQKFLMYLRKRYGVSRAIFFGGVETHDFPHDYVRDDSVPLKLLTAHIEEIVRKKGRNSNEAELLLLDRHLKRISFYRRLEEFGYELVLKPVKLYVEPDGATRRKANCDVDMAYRMMLEQDNFDRLVVVSGDGDFLPVLKHFRTLGKEVFVLARGKRTAKEIRQFAGSDFRDFATLKDLIRFEDK